MLELRPYDSGEKDPFDEPLSEIYECEGCGEQLERHIYKEGAGYHVFSYATSGTTCSKEKCEKNHDCSGNNLEEKLD